MPPHKHIPPTLSSRDSNIPPNVSYIVREFRAMIYDYVVVAPDVYVLPVIVKVHPTHIGLHELIVPITTHSVV